MAVDRGGLQYGITVEDDFSANLDAFRTRTREAKEEWKGLKRELADTRSTRRDPTAKQAREVERSAKAAARAVKTFEEALTRDRLAHEAWNRELRNQALARAEARVAVQKGLRLQRTELTQDQAKVAAERKITKVLQEKVIAEQAAQAVRERGLELTDREIKRLGSVLVEEERLRKAREAAAEAAGRTARDAQKQLEADNAKRVLALREAITARLKEQVALEERTSKAAERSSVAAQQQAEADNAARVAALREAITSRLKDQVAIEGRIADASERAAVAAQKQSEAENTARVAALRKAIVTRLERQVELEARIRDAVERTAVAEQRRNELAEQNRIRALRENIQQRAAAGQAFGGPGLVARVKAAQQAFDRLGNAIGISSENANRAAFTYRRLFGILAAFTAVRVAFREFRNLSTSLVTLNGEAEKIEVGIAGVIAAVSDIRDASGQAVTGVDAFNLAQAEARRQINLLRIDALATTATFEELSEAFQVGLGPGLAAGLNIDEVRVLSRQISQAATAIGLSQNQLSEEIRSILGGTIRQTQTRIAAVLGITNEDIRNARETGELFSFLQERLQDFDEAGRRAARTLPGLQQRLRDAFQFVLREGGFGLFEDTKDLLEDILNNLIEVDEALGTVSVNPQAVAVVEEIAEGLRVAVQQSRRFLETITNNDAISVAQTFRGIIEGTSTILSGIVEGAIIGIAAIRRGLGSVRNLIRNLTGFDIFDARNFQAIVTLIAAIATISFSVQLAWQAVSVALGGVRLAASAFLGTAKLLAVTLAALAPSARALAAALGIANINSKALLLTAGKLAAVFAVAAVAAAAISAGLKGATEDTETVRGLALVFNEVGIEIRRSLGQISNAEAVRQINELRENTKAAGKDASGFAEVIANEIDAFFAPVTDRIAGLFKAIEDQGSDIGDSLEEPADSVRNALEGVFLGASQALDELEQKLKQFRDESDESFFDTEATVAGLGLTGTVLEQIQARIDASRRAYIESNDIRAESLAIEKEIARLQARVQSDESLDENARSRTLLRLSALRERLAEFGEAEVQIEQTLQRLASQRVADAAIEANFALARENAIQRIATARDNEIAAAVSIRDFGKADLADAKARLLIATEQAQQAQQLRDIEEERLGNLIEQAQFQRDSIVALMESGESGRDLTRDLQRSEFEINELLAQRALLQERNLLLTQQDLALIETIRAELQRAQDIQDQPVRFAFIDAAEQFDLNTAVEKFEAFRDIATNIITGLSETIASLLTDALDPTSDATLQERFGQFLRSIAQQIIQTFVQIAVAKAVLGLTGSPFGAFFNFNEGGSVPGLNKGGSVPHAPHRRARGYAGGGSISPAHRRYTPPPGVHPKDTVPAWLTPREFVLPVKAAEKYRDSLEALRRGLVDPMALKALSGRRAARRGSVRAARGPGFNAGGSVPSAPSRAPQAPQEQSSSPSLAVIVSNEESARKIIEGGKNAFLEFLGSAEVQAVLGR